MMRMSLLDRAFYLLDTAQSPQDFTLILHLNDLPNIDNFYEGARSAMNRFPTSACCVERNKWVWRENKYFKLELASTVSECESQATIERLINEPFHLRQGPVRQALILNGTRGARVVTRFHHSAADGLSAALWLGHQLNVAYGLETAQPERAPFTHPDLRSVAARVWRSKFAFEGASDPLWTSSSMRSGSRRWHTISFPSDDLQKLCRRAGGFTYNDLLATCALEVLLWWHSKHNADCTRIGLWIPMNIRREQHAGFGNGTSRIRVYANYDANAPFLEKCRQVRRQVSWTSKHGEWVVPEISWFSRLPNPVTKPLLRNYLKLPSVDMATAVLSHAGSWVANAGEAFKHVARIECIGLLHSRQKLAINAATHSGQTWLTFTYDPALLSADDVQQLGETYQQQVGIALRELS